MAASSRRYVLACVCVCVCVYAVAAVAAADTDALLFTGELRALLSTTDSPTSSIDAAALQQIHAAALQHEQTDAMYVLAMLKFYGQHVGQDVAGAVRLLQRLAQRGHRDAEFALGVLHATGSADLPRDDRASAAWLASSANRGHADAKWMLATLYNDGRGVAAADPQRALALLEDAATADQNPRAMFHLGVMYEYGRAVPRDLARAAQLYRQASERHVADATFYLALMHAAGRGVPKSMAQALRLLNQAADRGHAAATLRLGELYADGDGVAPDYTAALHFFQRASKDPRVGRVAGQRAVELQFVVAQAETRVREQERVLGVPLRVQVATIDGR